MKRCLAITVFFLTAWLAAPSFGQKLRTVTIGMTGRTMATLTFEMSIRKGHFKREGLDIKLITIRQSDVIIKAIMAGELDFMSIVPTAILASVRRPADSHAGGQRRHRSLRSAGPAADQKHE